MRHDLRALARALAQEIGTMPLPQDAKALADAIEAGMNKKTLADAVFAAMAPATSGVIDIGANKVLAVIPGYNPLADPSDHFFVLDEL